VGKIGLIEYRNHLEKIAKFLQGDTSGVCREIKKEMAKAATRKQFETAARLRDQLKSLELLREKQNAILAKKVDWDIVSLAENSGFVCVNLFKIRGGKMFDKENFVYELPRTINHGGHFVLYSEIMQRFLEQYYQETSSIPKIIYTQIPANNEKLISDIIKSRFKKTTLIVCPQKGQAKKLTNLGKLNAEEYIKNWLTDKAGSLDKINQALKQLKTVLHLPETPARIEAYDISNIQGTNPVGSMVVFKDGLPAKSEYRKFKIQNKNTPDDFAMMKEMLARRFFHSVIASEAKQSRHNNKIAAPRQIAARNDKWPLPDLIVIDGGKGQLNVVVSLIHNSKFIIPIIGLAKKIEEIFLPNQNEPIILGHDQPALQLLQRLRDEAHRFGITFHRSLRSKQAVKSALDDIPRLGPKTKKLLKTKFGTVAQIKKTSFNDLSNVVGEKLAKIIYQNL